MDEVGSRVHITNINVPKEITEIENKVEELKDQKAEVIRSQQYEKAAELRDSERKLLEQLEEQKRNGRKNPKRIKSQLQRRM